jgi:hypothetical protein
MKKILWTSIKLQICSVKDNIKRMRTSHKVGENIFVEDICSGRVLSQHAQDPGFTPQQ